MLLKKNVPFYVLLISVAVAGTAGFFISRNLKSGDESNDLLLTQQVCRDNQFRLSGYHYIKPLLFMETECESPELLGVKSQLQGMINEYRNDGVIREASVYVRRLNQGEWFEVNPGERYLPGSLMKVPELITFMRMNQLHPGTLDRKVSFERPFITGKEVHYTSKSIELGHSYTIRELLTYMIVYSDNNATALLNGIMDLDIFKKVFTDMGIPAPDLTARDIPITAGNFSRFMRAIFNATYLSIDESEYCAELLSRSQFESGIRSGVPANVEMAHKFGEAGNANAFYFCESAIVYSSGSPYLVTVMTQGKDLAVLPSVIKDISKKTFELIGA